MSDVWAENPVRWVSIDPGLGGTGLAFFDNERLLVGIPEKNAPGIHTVRPDKSAAGWMEEAVSICDKAEDLFALYSPTKIVIEEPFISLKGKKTLVAANTNSVVKLSIIAGMLIWTARSVMESHRATHLFQVETVLPSKWKGQLPDKALKMRIEEWARKTKTELPKRLSEHARDALGLGLSCLKEL